MIYTNTQKDFAKQNHSFKTLLISILFFSSILASGQITPGDNYLIRCEGLTNQYIYDNSNANGDNLDTRNFGDINDAFADNRALWTITEPSTGYFRFVNVATGRVISAGNWDYIGENSGLQYNYFDMADIGGGWDIQQKTRAKYTFVTTTNGYPIYSMFMEDGGSRHWSSGMNNNTIGYTTGCASASHCNFAFIAEVKVLQADAGFNKIIFSGNNVQIGGSPTASGGAGGYTYLWSNGSTDANPTVNPTETTTYTVTVTDSNNDVATDNMVVYINSGSVSGTKQTDTVFWFAVPQVAHRHGDLAAPNQETYFLSYFRITSIDEAATVTISMPANPTFTPITVNVAQKATQSVELSNDPTKPYNLYVNNYESYPANQTLNKGVLIESTSPISVYYEVDYIKNTDIFVLKGMNALGSSFVVPGQNEFSNKQNAGDVSNVSEFPNDPMFHVAPRASFDIVATEDNTIITIMPRHDIEGRSGGASFQITLNKGQVYSARATNNNASFHLGGSTITSNKPIAITVKDDTMEWPGNAWDTWGDQLVPINSIGKRYIVTKGYMQGNDRAFITAVENTTVTYNGSNYSINAGEVRRFELTGAAGSGHFFEADKNVLLVQITGGSNTDNEFGGAIIPQLDCTGSEAVSFTRSTTGNFHIQLLVPDGGQGNFLLVKSDGTALPINAGSFTAVPNTGNQWFTGIFSFTTAQIPVGSQWTISNTTSLFHLALNAHEGTDMGSRFGYFSNFQKNIATASTDIEPIICSGDPITLMADGGVSYQWNNGQTLSSFQITPTTTSTYTVTVTDALGCTDDAEIIIEVNSLPSVNAGLDKEVCLNSSISFNDATQNGGKSPISYVWNNTSTLNNNTALQPVATPTDVGTPSITYTVTVSDANKCTATDAMILTVNPLPTVDAGDHKDVCLNNSITFNASAGGGSGLLSYSWNNSSILDNATNITPKATPTNPAVSSIIFTVTVTDEKNCSAIDDLTLTIHSLPNANAGNDINTCSNDSIQLNAIGGIKYQWSTKTGLSDSTIANPNVMINGLQTYTVLVTDSNNCTDTDDISVTIYPLTTANAGNDVSVCSGDSVQLNATGGINFLWAPSSGLSDNTIANPKVSTSGISIYNVTVTDINGCTDDDEITVTMYPEAIANAGNDISTCSGDSIQLNANGGITYSWSPNIGLSDSSIANPKVMIHGAVVYTVYITDLNNCTDSDEINISLHPSANADAGSDVTICSGTSTTLSALGGTQFIWNDLITDATRNVSPISSTTYSVTVTDANGCTDLDSVIVYVNPLPSVDAGSDTSFCEGYAFQMNAYSMNTDLTYTWSPNQYLSATNIANPISTPEQTITYTVQITDLNNCSNTDDIIIQVHTTPAIPADISETVCKHTNTSLTLNSIVPGNTINWYHTASGGNIISSGATYAISNVQNNDTLYFEIVSPNNCISNTRGKAIINLGIQPTASFTADADTILQNTVINFNNTSTNANQFYWDFGSEGSSTLTNPSIEFKQHGSYNIKLMAISTDNCSDTVLMNNMIYVRERTAVFIPTAFTPNGDNVNDYFEVYGEVIKNLNIKIYNEWGLLLWEGDKRDSKWNGTVNGKNQPAANYAYIVNYTTFNNETFTKSGIVTLIR